jgi:hypothetical protein
MHSRIKSSTFVALAVAALSATNAMGATEFTNHSSWALALTGGAYNEASEFSSQNLANTTLNVPGYGAFSLTGSVTSLNVNNVPLKSVQDTAQTITPASGSRALMLWLGANQTGSGQFSSQPLSITLTDANGGTQTFSLITGATRPSFWGFTSGTDINTITISAPVGYNVDVMDFYAGTYPADSVPPPTPTAEGATIVLVASGLVFLGLRHKFASTVPA